MFGAAVGGAQGYARQIEHCEDVCVELFVGQAESENVEIGDGMCAFQPEKRNGIFPHLRLEIHPRAIDPLGQHIVSFVDQIVEDRQPQIRAAQFVDVREGQGDSGPDGRVVSIFDDGIEFAAGVAGGLGYFVQHPVQGTTNLLGSMEHRLFPSHLPAWGEKRTGGRHDKMIDTMSAIFSPFFLSSGHPPAGRGLNPRWLSDWVYVTVCPVYHEMGGG